MQVYVNGKKVTLTQNNFVAKGGEGSIFEKSGVAYKIYEDPKKMIPEAKIKELSELDIENIVRPIHLIYNPKQTLIGFTMNWIGSGTHALCKLFTNRFRDSNGIENDMVIDLVENIKKVIYFIHENKCLIVDGNELNYLVKDDFITPYLIDINAWQTRSFPATAIMPSVRDWTTDIFSDLSDWFSFAIVSFQLFVGIHPFKGKHEKYKRNDFRSRIVDGISVFNKDVRVPPSTRDFNLIPSAYKDWYYKLFEKNERLLPPSLPGTAEKVPVKVILVQSTDNFEIRVLYEFESDILFHNPAFNVTKTKDELFISKTGYKVSTGTEILFTPLDNIPLLVKIEDRRVKFKTLKTGYTIKDIQLECTDMMIVQNTLFLKNESKLIELDFRTFNSNVIPSIKVQWNIEPKSSAFFSNVVMQSVLGKAYAVIPIPGATSSCLVKPITELNDYKVIDAKYDNNVLVVIGHKDGKYHRFTFKFGPTGHSYEVVNDIDYAAINFVTLDNGVCVQITEDDAVEIFMNRVDKLDRKRIEDPEINSTMRLFKDGTRVGFFKGKKLYSMKMK